MFFATGEVGQAGGGLSVVIVIGLVIWALSRLDHTPRERDLRKQRKREIEAIVRSRMVDVDIFRDILDEIDRERRQQRRP